MRENFDDALQITFGFEGGWSDNPNDPGGETNYGITASTFEAAKKAGLVRSESVADITKSDAESIYRAWYWDRCRCDDLPDGIDIIVFDAAVNCGVGSSGKFLQRAINRHAHDPVAVDGGIGPKTVKATMELSKLNCQGLFDGCLLERLHYYREISDKNRNLQRFLRGWMRRTLDLDRRKI